MRPPVPTALSRLLMSIGVLVRSGFLLSIILGPGMAAAAPADGTPEVKFLTYNVLADRVHPEVRLPALFDLLGRSNADVIALQEVAPWFLKELEGKPWAAAYHSPTAEGKRFAPGGLLILSKSPILKFNGGRLPSRQGRVWLVVETEVRSVKLTIANCHLESPLEAGNIRAGQLDLFFQQLAGAADALFMGDFNFGDGEQPDTAKLPPAYLDAWSRTNPGVPGFTWNIEKSRMAAEGSFPNEKSRRLDRILIRSPHFTPVSTLIMGDAPVMGKIDVFPSDHFGLISTMRVNPEKNAVPR